MQISPWAWEITALFGVFVSFAGLVTLLAVFDGRTIFDWESITLNTIVSTISLILRAFLLFSISECVGQWKWILFDRSERSLMDFERIDSASRGPLGSLFLSWQRNIPWTLRLGVIVTVLTLAVDPFSQQLVQIEDKVSEVYEPFEAGGHGLPASVPRAYSYRRGHLFKINETSSDDSDEKIVHMGARPELSMQAAILRGLSTNDGLIMQSMDYVCHDSMCTWPRFETLGICATCQGLAPRMERVRNFGEVFKSTEDLQNDDVEISAENVTAVVLPNGHFLANLDGCLTEKGALEEGCEWSINGDDTVRVSGNVMSTYGTSDPSKTISMQDLDTMIWAMSILRLDEPQREWGHLDPWDGPGDESEYHLYNETDPTRRDPDANLSRWPESPVHAEECALYYCVKTIQDLAYDNAIHENVANTVDSERKADSWKPVAEDDYSSENIPSNTSSLEFDTRYAALEMTDLVLHYANDSAEHNDFNISHEAIKSISSYFQDTFKTPTSNESEVLDLVRERFQNASVVPNGRIRSNNLPEPGILEGLYNEDRPSIWTRLDMLATSMTIEMRNNAGKQLDLPDGVYADRETRGLDNPKFGTTHITRPTYRAEWYWISLHAVIVLFGVLFCLMTMLSAKRSSTLQVIWKNHSLATMGQGAVAGQRLGKVTTIRELEKRASSEKVSMPLVETAKEVPTPLSSEESVESSGTEATSPPPRA